MKQGISALLLAAAGSIALAQSGEPSPAGQAITAQGEASAEAAVKARHDKLVARKSAKAAKKASKKASAASG